MKTLQDYIEELREEDVDALIDILSITSNDIIDRFDDRIEDVYDKGEEDSPILYDEEE